MRSILAPFGALSRVFARIGAFVRRPSVRFALLWAVLPNLLFVPLSFFASPIRTPSILVYLFVGLATAWAPGVVAAVLLFAAILFDLLVLVSGAYRLSVFMLLDLLPFARQVNFFASPAFVFGVLGLATMFAIMVWLRSRWRADLRSASPYLAVGLVAVFAVLDASVNLPSTKLIGSVHAEQPFHSAVERSGFAERALETEQDKLFVLLESYGSLTDPALRAAVEQPLSDPRLRARYDVARGISPYYGSTTAAEMRELCGTKAPYETFLAAPGTDCLPSRLRDKGYETIGVHAFTGEFFEREVWWPNIGFQQADFGEDLARADRARFAKFCGAVFTGLCDSDVSGYVRDLLTEPHERARLVYWLTLNTHIPVAPETDGTRFACGTDADRFRDGQTCGMADLWADAFQAIVDIALDERLPPTEILIAGDHPPPSWTRRGRAHFDETVVPWISLVPKAVVTSARSAGR